MNIPFDYFVLLGGYLIALAVTVGMIPLLRAAALRRGWVDVPDGGRKAHEQPTPTIGGLGIAAGFLVSFLYFLLVQKFISIEIAAPPLLFWASAFIILGVGFYDDIRGVGFKRKFLFQFLVAYLLLHAGYRIDLNFWVFAELDAYSQALWSIPLTLFWIVGVINAVNLIDGLDGLAGGTVMIAFFFLSAIFGMHGHFGLAALSLLMVGSLAGFLVFNFKPASIFMGDSGSLFIGFVFAAFTLQQPIHGDPIVALIAPVLLLGLPLLDTALAFIRRMAAGRAVFAADSDHIHHRLRARMSESRTVKYLYGVEMFFAAGAVMMTAVATQYVALVIGALIVSTLLGLKVLGYLSSPAQDADLTGQPDYDTSEGDSLGVGDYGPAGDREPPVVQEPVLPESTG